MRSLVHACFLGCYAIAQRSDSGEPLRVPVPRREISNIPFRIIVVFDDLGPTTTTTTTNSWGGSRAVQTVCERVIHFAIIQGWVIRLFYGGMSWRSTAVDGERAW
jgi:hypothetical protein